MSELKKELNLAQGIGLLSTSLLGTGVFAVPAMVVQISGKSGLWAWPLLLILVFPIALIFAQLGKNYANAGGVAYFIANAFNPILGRVTGWSFLSVIPFGLPAALYIASGFWQSLFNLSPTSELGVQIVTLLLIWVLGLFGAGASGWVQSIIALLITGLVAVICFSSSPSPLTVEWPKLAEIQPSFVLSALAVMFWCFVGLEAFVHLTAEFKRPEKDFPRALIIGLLLAGFIYWAFTAAVVFYAPDATVATTALPQIIKILLGKEALWIVCIIGYLACFASINIYCQSFARLIWAQAEVDYPSSWLAKLSRNQAPINGLTIVVLLSLFFLFVIHFFTISLNSLLEYANGVFILIYLLAMIAAIKLLRGKWRILAIFCAIICAGLLLIIGLKSLYAIGVFIVFWWLAKHVVKGKS